MNLPIANRSPGLITFAAVTMGSLAMLRAWLVLYPHDIPGLLVHLC
jgi:hypothetical protein